MRIGKYAYVEQQDNHIELLIETIAHLTLLWSLSYQFDLAFQVYKSTSPLRFHLEKKKKFDHANWPK